MPIDLNDPRQIAQRGESIYSRLYRAEYEKNHRHYYAAIDITDETATIGRTASEALHEAKLKNPHGFFHLIHIGHPSTFEVGLAYRNVHADRLRR